MMLTAPCHKVQRKMLEDIRDNLGNIIFKKDYMYTKITSYLARMYESVDNNVAIINALNRIKNMDEYTFTHSINTAFYAMLIAMWMDLEDQQIINATQAGLLHDIGKIYIPNDILNKNGPLTDEEYQTVQKHTLYGYYFISGFDEISQDVKRAVLFHHERKNSQGYPLDAAQDYIGVVSRIVAIADVYDAMTTDRVYKKAATPLEAIEYLKNQGTLILDSDILQVFIQNIPIYDFKVNA